MQAIAALKHDPEVYVRAGSLSRIIEHDGTERNKIARSVGAPVIRFASAPWIRDRLSIHARFMSKRKATMKEIGEAEAKSGKTIEFVDVDTPPPAWIGVHMLERGAWSGYRALVGIVTAPTMRADGSVLQERGYDSATGLVYLPTSKFPPIIGEPTKEHATKACAELLDVIDDFNLDDVGRSAWLALLFTLCARELAHGAVPLFAVDASTPGSGKGLLVNAPHRIAYGRDAPHASPPEDEAELRKSITTVLLAGDPAFLLDNVKEPLGGASLDAVITAPIWKPRLLGKNEDSGVLVPRVVWLATGNGLQLVGDLARRTIRIRIATTHENPERRTDYKHADRAGADKLLNWVSLHRVRLVTAALTCLRAWHVAGRPGAATIGSFESWAETIGRCVQWLTGMDPTRAFATEDAALDPESSRRRSIRSDREARRSSHGSRCARATSSKQVT